jgi:hypothetical protein
MDNLEASTHQTPDQLFLQARVLPIGGWQEYLQSLPIASSHALAIVV